MYIGPYKLSNNLVLAPMEGVTDRPFRQLCKDLGAGLAVSEMVTSNSLLWGSKKTQRRANHVGETKPCSVQIAGADPGMMAQAATSASGASRPDDPLVTRSSSGRPAPRLLHGMHGGDLFAPVRRVPPRQGLVSSASTSRWPVQ